MVYRVFLFTTCLLLAVLGSGSAGLPQASAQIRIVESNQTIDQAQLDDIIRRGRELEAGNQWGEALAHYEDGLHSYPDNRSLSERHDAARIQYDLSRRYRDTSFRRAAASLSHSEALSVYNKVLSKIETHYVHRPQWRELLSHGTRSLQVALSKPAFVKEHLAGVSAERVEQFRAQMNHLLAAADVRSRREALDTASAVARLASSALGIPPGATILEYTCGATSSLDNYSTYLSGDQLRDVFSQIEGNFVGLGIEIKAANGALLLINVISSSPAEKAGLRPGDLIVAVDDRATKGLDTDTAAGMLQGGEGSVARLRIVRGERAPLEISVRRAHVEVPSIEDDRIVDGASGIAYLKLTSFQKTTNRDLDAALWRLHRKGMRSLIIDLRGNPGGLLTTSVEVADKFVTSGTIVSTKGRSAQEDFNYTAHRVGTWRVPLVVLIDGDSASASEIFAGAIQDNRRGTIVGRRSYGKGSVQGIFPLYPPGSKRRYGIRLTTAKFYSPNGRAISRAGVTPDVTVRLVAKPADGKLLDKSKQDADLLAAMQVAQKQLAQR